MFHLSVKYNVYYTYVSGKCAINEFTKTNFKREKPIFPIIKDDLKVCAVQAVFKVRNLNI